MVRKLYGETLTLSLLFAGVRALFNYITVTNLNFTHYPEFLMRMNKINDSPLPHFVALLADGSLFNLTLLGEAVMVVLSLMVWQVTKSRFAFIFLNIAPLALGLNIEVLGFGFLDDYLGMLFFTAAIVAFERRTAVRGVNLTYLFTVLTMLSHMVPTLFLIMFFAIRWRRDWRPPAFITVLIIPIIFTGLLGYSYKISQVLTSGLVLNPLTYTLKLFPLLTQLFNYTWPAAYYLNWIMFISLGLFFGFILIIRGRNLFTPVVFLSVLPFILPFDAGFGPHSLLWRLSWMNIVIIPLLFLRTSDVIVK